mmetsp:Transcript_11714/g.17199  ORF Transcript_11714/g.17199 Transcript_11714/m.17199 type:complete len:88 (+) Transcript_11714:56-319(+)
MIDNSKYQYGSISPRKRVYANFQTPVSYSDRHLELSKKQQDRSEKKKKTWTEKVSRFHLLKVFLWHSVLVFINIFEGCNRSINSNTI